MWVWVSTADILQYKSSAVDRLEHLELLLFNRKKSRFDNGISKPKKQRVYEALWICMFNDKAVKKIVFNILLFVTSLILHIKSKDFLDKILFCIIYNYKIQ